MAYTQRDATCCERLVILRQFPLQLHCNSFRCAQPLAQEIRPVIIILQNDPMQWDYEIRAAMLPNERINYER